MRRVKISEICEQIRGVSYKPTDVVDSLSGIPILRANNISDDVINYNNLVYIKKERISPKQILKKGDILICTSSGSKNLVGKAGLITKSNFISSFGAFCKVLRAYNTSSEYLFHYFCSDAYRDRISALSAGANINNIKNEHIDTLEIPIYPLDKERNLLKLLNKTKVLISKRKQQLSKLDELAKSRFIEMFGDVKHFKKIEDFVDGNILSAKKNYKENSTINYIDISSIDNKNFSITNITKYNFKDAPSRAQQCVIDGDILISTVRPNLKNIAIIKSHESNLVASSGFCVLRAINCPKEFLFGIVSSDDFTKKMTSLTTGANYPAIKDSDVLQYPIPDIPLKEMKSFAEFMQQLDKSKFRMKKCLRILSFIRHL